MFLTIGPVAKQASLSLARTHVLCYDVLIYSSSAGSAFADPENFLRGPVSDQGGSDKVLPFQNPYPGKSIAVKTLSPPLDLRMKRRSNCL